MAEVNINWDFSDTKPSDVIEIYRHSSSDVPTNSAYRITTQMVSSNRYKDKNLEIGKTYYYKIILVRDGANVETRSMRVDINEPIEVASPRILSVSNDGLIKTSTARDIGTHLETDWVIDGDLVSDISLKNTTDLTQYQMDLGVDSGDYQVDVRVRYRGDLRSTDWSNVFQKSISYVAEVDDGTFDAAKFLGEVPVRNLINGKDLADSLGLSAGTSQYSNEPWLKFDIDGEIVYIAKKPYRYGLHWQHIYQVGAVYGTDDFGANPSGGNKLQDARVSIGGKSYKVTLIKGASVDPTPIEAGHDLSWTHNSEWNRTMYGIHSGNHSDPRNPVPPAFVSTEYNQYAGYTDNDLLLYFTAGNGSYTWSQESVGINTEDRLYRAAYGVTYADRLSSTAISAYYGWRPVLREE